MPQAVITGATRRSTQQQWFPARADQIAAVREHVRDVLEAGAVGEECRWQAELLVSEVATNVVRHTSSDGILVGIAVRGAHVTIDVTDTVASAPPVHASTAPVPTDPATGHGRGLAILDTVAAEWGVRRHDSVTTTWFTLGTDDPDRMTGDVDGALVDSLQAALGRSQLLLRMVERLGRARTAEQVGDAVTRTLRPHVGAVFTGIALRGDDDVSMHYLSLDPLPEATVEYWASFPLDQASPPAAATLNNRPYFHRHRAAAAAEFPGLDAHMADSGVGAIAHLPLTVLGRSIGTLAVAWADPHECDADTRALLSIVAGYAAQALARR